jgi:replicative DNA helicase
MLGKEVGMEKIVLGTLLTYGQGFETVDVEPDDLSFPYDIILRAISKLFQEEKPYDLAAVAEYLSASGDLKKIGGRDTLMNISLNGTSLSLLPHYVQLLKESISRRKVADAIAKAHEIVSNGGSIEEALALIEAVQTQIKLDETEVLTPEDAFQEFEKLRNRKKEITLPWPSLKKIIPSVDRGEYMIVAGRPGSGKTAFLLSLIHYITIRRRIPTLYVSLETPAGLIIGRLLAIIGQRDLREVREGNVRKEEKELLDKAPLALVTRTDCTPTSLAKIIRRHPNGISPALVIVDYIQLMHSGSRSNSRYEEVSKISRALKLLAMQEDVALICASQLSRYSERVERDPELSDLRDSSALESDADYVLLLYPYSEDEKNGFKERRIMNLKVAKNRNGPIGSMLMEFRAFCSSYEELIGQEVGVEESVPF